MLIINIIIQIIAIIFLAPLVTGIIKKIKAFTQKRKGPPITQFFKDLSKLLKKDMVVSNRTSWIFKVTPLIVLGTSIAALIFLPVSLEISSSNLSISGDIIVVISLIAMGRFFMVLAGLDTASTFGGMGSSREVLISALFEPALIVSVFTMALISKTTSIEGIMRHSMELGLGIVEPVNILIFVSIFIILIAETARIPVDDPSTHLELTMIHEAMLLEYSGRNLAYMEYGSAIKQLFFITLLANLFIPSSWVGNMELGYFGVIILSLLFYVVKVIIITVLVAIVEVFTVKLRLVRVSELAMFSFIAAFIGFLQIFVMGGK